MRISKTIEQVLNKQIEMEYDAMAAYTAMWAWAEYTGLSGTAKWMYCQLEEEHAHAKKVYQYMLDRDAMPRTPIIPAPKKQKYNDLLDCLKAAFDHEKQVTGSWNKAYDKAIEEKDNVTASFIKWYLDEQVEEEAKIMNYIDRLEHFGNDPHVVFMVDQELGNK
jgi:ferritin